MKIKALNSFCGVVNMVAGEVREVADEIAKDLIRAGYAVEHEEDKKGKKPAKPAEAPKAEEPVADEGTTKKSSAVPDPDETPAEKTPVEETTEEKTSKKTK